MYYTNVASKYEGCAPAIKHPPKAIYIAEGGQLAVGVALSIIWWETFIISDIKHQKYSIRVYFIYPDSP